MVSVAPNPVPKTEPKKSVMLAELTEHLDQIVSRRNSSTTTSNGSGGGNQTVANNNGHSWAEGSGDGSPSDWSRSFHGLSSQPFDKEISEILLTAVNPTDIEIKPGTPLYTNLSTKVQS